MKIYIKLILNILGILLLLTNTSLAKKIVEKKFIPIVSDELISMASYDKITYTTVNNLKVPPLSSDNNYRDLVVQCENDISYFLMAYMYYDGTSVIVDKGDVIIDERYNKDNVAYIKGHIEGTESVVITGNVFQNDEIVSSITKTCNPNITSVNNLKVPTFNGNSQGKLVIQCERDVVYYIMAYDCLRSDTNPWVTTDNGTPITDEKKHVGEVFYVKGHVERKNSDSVTITGHVYSGGKELYIWSDWLKTCP